MNRASFFRLSFAALALLAAALAVGCDDVVEDATFRLWCGESLCAWKTEVGSIRRAPTWHKKDFGVELLETPTAISQEVDKSPRCLEFTTVADVDPAAQVTVAVDFNRDGTIDYEQPIAETGWRESKTQVTAPPVYDGIRFVITKKGAGRAVLAQMRVQSRDACTAPPVTLSDLPLGAPCFLGGGGAECRSGVCCDGLCSECSIASEVGREGPDGGIFRNVPAGCAEGACARRDVRNLSGWFTPAVPLQCDPGSGARPGGAECLTDDDCASGACEDARSEAIRSGFGEDGGVQTCEGAFPDGGHPECVFTRVLGGRCR